MKPAPRPRPTFFHDQALTRSHRVTFTIESKISTVHVWTNDGYYYETMVFGGPFDGLEERHKYWIEARLFHNKVVRHLKNKETGEIFNAVAELIMEPLYALDRFLEHVVFKFDSVNESKRDEGPGRTYSA